MVWKVKYEEAEQRAQAWEQKYTELQAKLQWYEEQFRLSQQRTYGQSSEKSSSDQLELPLFNEAEITEHPMVEEPTVETVLFQPTQQEKRRAQRKTGQPTDRDRGIQTGGIGAGVFLLQWKTACDEHPNPPRAESHPCRSEGGKTRTTGIRLSPLRAKRHPNAHRYRAKIWEQWNRIWE